MSRSRGAALLVGLTLIGAIGACSSDDDTDRAVSTASSTTVETTTTAAAPASSTTSTSIGSPTTVAPTGPTAGAPRSAPTTAPPDTTTTTTTAPTTAPPATTTAAPRGSAAITIQAFTFTPPVLDVAAGTVVTATNRDGAPHTWTADDGSWSSGELQTDAAASHTFDRAGTFDYHCEIHPSMRGSVTVT